MIHHSLFLFIFFPNILSSLRAHSITSPESVHFSFISMHQNQSPGLSPLTAALQQTGTGGARPEAVRRGAGYNGRARMRDPRWPGENGHSDNTGHGYLLCGGLPSLDRRECPLSLESVLFLFLFILSYHAELPLYPADRGVYYLYSSKFCQTCGMNTVCRALIFNRKRYQG